MAFTKPRDGFHVVYARRDVAGSFSLVDFGNGSCERKGWAPLTSATVTALDDNIAWFYWMMTLDITSMTEIWRTSAWLEQRPLLRREKR